MYFISIIMTKELKKQTNKQIAPKSLEYSRILNMISKQIKFLGSVRICID